MFILMFIRTLIIVVQASFLIRSISNPIISAVGVADKIAAGNLSSSSEERSVSTQEIIQASERLAVMVQELTKTVDKFEL